MADVHNKERRSYNMSRIKAKDTKPELLVRKFLFKNGFRYRLHVKHLPGKPDIVLKKSKTIIEIKGCFWHHHTGCKYAVLPKTRTDWWKDKLKATSERDKTNKIQLKQLGWNVIEIWECELKKDKLQNTLNSLLKNIISD